jgi:predicted transcriptional regulator
MRTGHENRSPAARHDFGPLLATLVQADVDFIIVGPAAVRARGMDISGADSSVLDVTPNPTPHNLDILASALSSGADPRLRTGDTPAGLPAHLSAETFRALPVLPLTTALGELNVLLRPVGAPATYDELLDDVSSVELDAVGILVPTIEALLRGLAGGAKSPDHQILAQLRRAHESAALLAAAQVDPEPVLRQEGDLEQVILATLKAADSPMSVRELLFVTRTRTKVPYKQVKSAAEALTVRGELLRDKDGAAYRYRHNTDTDDQVAHRILALLADRPDPQATLDKVRSLFTTGNQT